MILTLLFIHKNVHSSRNNSATQADYVKAPKITQMPAVPFKPVPPPKPKNYRAPVQGSNGQWENGVSFC